MTGALHDGGMTTIEIEPDTQRSAALREMLEELTLRPPAAHADPLRDKIFITTMNNPRDDDKGRDIGFLPAAVLERFKPIEFKPLGDEVAEKIAALQIAKELGKHNLTERQHKAAEQFLKQQQYAIDKASGARGIFKRIKESFDSASFKQLMRENSNEWSLSEMSQAIKGGGKGNVHAPTTARFRSRGAP
ncbi:MAG: hypothetical protein PSY14_11380 [bacterium]|nr:hypothetical protein [bacterium]